MKVVFDTNIYISAFAIQGGNAEEAFLQAIRGTFILYTSVSILTETAQKLREKFDWDEEKIIRLLKLISKVAKVLKTKSAINILKDAPDNRILECAIEGNVDYIVTGDKHLLALKKYKNIEIISLSNFLNLIKEK